LAGCVFFIRDAASSPYREPWDWGGQDAADGARIDARDQIPREAAVRASPSMLQLLAEREQLYVLDAGQPLSARQATQGVDTVVLDARTIESWPAADRQAFYEGMGAQGFRVTVNEQEIVVFQESPDAG
jgi:hypothetical protein